MGGGGGEVRRRGGGRGKMVQGKTINVKCETGRGCVPCHLEIHAQNIVLNILF